MGTASQALPANRIPPCRRRIPAWRNPPHHATHPYPRPHTSPPSAPTDRFRADPAGRGIRPPQRLHPEHSPRRRGLLPIRHTRKRRSV